MKDALGHGSNGNGGAAHQQGVNAASRGRFTDDHIAALRQAYAGTPDKMDPTGPAMNKMRDMIARMSPEQHQQLAGAGIKWVSTMARTRMILNGNKK
jgi:hypothetical protein